MAEGCDTKQLAFTQYSSYLDRHCDINVSFILKTLASHFTKMLLQFQVLTICTAGKNLWW